MAPKKDVIDKSLAQKKLVITWLSSGLVTSLLFIIVCWSRAGETGFSDALQWLFNYLGPGMTLIIGAFAYSANRADTLPTKYINQSYLRITISFTLVYIATIAIISAIAPVAMGEQTLLEYLNKFNLILSFLETSLLALLGIFFSKENEAQEKTS